MCLPFAMDERLHRYPGTIVFIGHCFCLQRPVRRACGAAQRASAPQTPPSLPTAAPTAARASPGWYCWRNTSRWAPLAIKLLFPPVFFHKALLVLYLLAILSTIVLLFCIRKQMKRLFLIDGFLKMWSWKSPYPQCREILGGRCSAAVEVVDQNVGFSSFVSIITCVGNLWKS